MPEANGNAALVVDSLDVRYSGVPAVSGASFKVDRGEMARSECSMIKLYATELAWDVLDKAMQSFGAMGMTKELPLQLMANHVRVARVYEGPSEVHRALIARYALQGRQVQM